MRCLGYVVSAMLFFLVSSAYALTLRESHVSKEMSALRYELDHVGLEFRKLKTQLAQERIWLEQLQMERDRMKPELKRAQFMFLKWLRSSTLAAPTSRQLLPLPTFSFEAAHRRSFSKVYEEQMQKSLSEFESLKKHLTETENQMNQSSLEIQSKQAYLLDLEQNLRRRLTEQRAFQRKIQMQADLLSQVESDAVAIRKDIERNISDISLDTQADSEETHTLRLPILGRIWRPFGRTKHPRYQTFTVSRGIHIETELGKPVEAVLPGDVIFVGQYGLFGQLIMMQHAGGIKTLYSGFSEVHVAQGQKITFRQPLGLSGYGYGLDYEGVYFEVRKGHHPIDPLKWMSSPR